MHATKTQKCQLECFWALESTERGDSNGTSRRANREVKGTQTQCQGRKCAKMGTTQSGKHTRIKGYNGRGGRKAAMKCDCAQKLTRWLGKAVAVKDPEVQIMARHVIRIALVLCLSGQHLNRPCNSGEATN
jgi:hypothetical protein